MKVIGIDLGVHKISLACFEDQKLVWCDTHVASGEQTRDQQLLELGKFANEIATLHSADSIWVEDALIGNNQKYSLSIAEVKGAVLTMLGNLRLYLGTDVRMVNVSTWKKEVVGHGNASKEWVKNYIDVTYPEYAPLCDGDQDRYDATCVGIYGLRITARSQDLHLTPE